MCAAVAPRSPGRAVAAAAVAAAAVATVAVEPAAATDHHTVDAVDLVTGSEDPVAVVALAVELLAVMASGVAVLAVRSAVKRFEGGLFARGLVVAEGGVGVLLVAQLWHVAGVVAPIMPAPAVVDRVFVAVALALFAVAAVDLYRSV